jgi:hypothetical protein
VTDACDVERWLLLSVAAAAGGSLPRSYERFLYEFFRRSEGADPPIYQYVEGHDGLAFTWKNFAHFFCDAVRGFLE